MKKKYQISAAFLVAVCLVPLVYSVYSRASELLHHSQKADGQEVLATVDGKAISSTSLTPFLQGGIDRSIALDRKITQMVLAEAAEKAYPKESKEGLESVRDETLSRIYTAKRNDVIGKEVSDKDIAAFYEKNIRAEDYKQLKVKIYLTSDAKDAQTFYEMHSQAGRAGRNEEDGTAKKMQYLKMDGDHFLSVAEIPYNLGIVLKKLKAGEFLQPVVVREGVLVAFLEDAKEMPRPPVEKLKDEIQKYLVNEKIAEEVKALRKAAKIELKG